MSDAQQAIPSPTRIRNRRRFSSHMVNGDVRLRLVLDDTIFALAAAFAAIGILYWLGNKQLGDSLYSAHLSIKETRELLTNGARLAGIVTFVGVMLFGLWSAIDAHRIVGPMHRLHRLLRDIEGGNLTHEIRFRQRDEFQEIAAAADAMVDRYCDLLSMARANADAISQALAAGRADEAAILEARRLAAELASQLASLRFPSGATPDVDDSPLK